MGTCVNAVKVATLYTSNCCCIIFETAKYFPVRLENRFPDALSESYTSGLAWWFSLVRSNKHTAGTLGCSTGTFLEERNTWIRVRP